MSCEVTTGLSSISLSPASITGGSSSTGTVTLPSPAPSGGAVVALSSDNGVAGVPSSVTIAAGASGANFPVTSSAVGTVTTAQISASYNGTQTATLTINPSVVSSLVLTPNEVVGGNASTGTVTLSWADRVGGRARR